MRYAALLPLALTVISPTADASDDRDGGVEATVTRTDVFDDLMAEYDVILDGEAGHYMVAELDVDLEVHLDALRDLLGDEAAELTIDATRGASAVVVTDGAAFDLYLDGAREDLFLQLRTDGWIIVQSWDGYSFGDDLRLHISEEDSEAIGDHPTPVSVKFGDAQRLSLAEVDPFAAWSDVTLPDEPLYAAGFGTVTPQSCAASASAFADDPDECDAWEVGSGCCDQYGSEIEQACTEAESGAQQQQWLEGMGLYAFGALLALTGNFGPGAVLAANGAVRFGTSATIDMDCEGEGAEATNECNQTVLGAIPQPDPACFQAV